MELTFSIIIPTYNRAHLIGQTILSALQENYLPYELIIVDDGSTDNTKEVVDNIIKNNSYKKIIYLHQQNSERAAARNKGLLGSTGDYVVFFDSDDTLYPNYLRVAYQEILKNKMPEFLHLAYDIKNSEGQIIGKSRHYNHPPNSELIHGNFLSCNGVVIRRDIALQNLFNENRVLSGFEDWELWLRLAVKYPLCYVNSPVTSTIINHIERSVVAPNKDKLIERVHAFMEAVLSNKELTNHFSNDLNSFRCSCLSYLSLHLGLMGQKKEAYLYLKKSISMSPNFIFKKRFFAIIKRLI